MKPNRNTRNSLLIIFFAITAVIIIICYRNYSPGKKGSGKETTSYDIAFLSNTSQISASASNFQAYHGVSVISEELGKNFNTYFVPSDSVVIQQTAAISQNSPANIQKEPVYKNEDSASVGRAGYSEMIQQAVNDGARLVICPDSSYAETLYSIQKDYINTYFILVDGVPHNSDHSDQTINYNVIPISYDEAEIGFLAGYALVYEGYTSLAFIGDSRASGVVHYGYGFLQGANYAARECNTANVDICYYYAEDTADAEQMAQKFYSSKIPVITATGDDIIKPLTEIASKQNAYLVSCGNYHDFYEESDYLIALSYKDIAASVANTVKNFYANDISGGKTITAGTGDNWIGFVYDNEKFSRFSLDVYDTVYRQLAEDKILLISDTTVSVEDLGLTNVTIK
ncbi:MAG: BMP family ABC transporter substrate-binding protein [Lachnospiraceae bacterium]|nr:BMP family ABC transporter substrate-binding protein [Lachnospiraceae bacterium]